MIITSNILNICEYVWWISQGWGGGLSVCKDDPSSAHTSSFVLTRPVPTTQWNHVTCTKHLHSRYVNYKQYIRNLDIHMESYSMHKIFTLKMCKLYIKHMKPWYTQLNHVACTKYLHLRYMHIAQYTKSTKPWNMYAFWRTIPLCAGVYHIETISCRNTIIKSYISL